MFVADGIRVYGDDTVGSLEDYDFDVIIDVIIKQTGC
jgi:hypothetical protein